MHGLASFIAFLDRGGPFNVESGKQLKSRGIEP